VAREDLTYAQLEMLCTVAETGSITGAALSLHVAQSSLSRSVAQMERTVGSALVVRGGRGVTLTVSGRQLYDIAKDLLASREAGFGRFRTYLAGQSGTVSIATLPSLVVQCLAPVVRRLRRSNPDVQFAIKDGVTSEVLRQVLDGTADFGLASHGALPPTLRAEPLLSDRMHLVVPARHPLTGREQIAWSELSGENVIALRAGSSIRPLLDAGFREAGISLQPLFEPSQLVTVAGLLAARLGVCPLPELAAEPVLKLAEATAIPLVGPVIYRQIDLIRHSERALPPAAQTVLDELRRPHPMVSTGASHR
jgi:LysR family carnitine catabolism transcriptional activator